MELLTDIESETSGLTLDFSGSLPYATLNDENVVGKESTARTCSIAPLVVIGFVFHAVCNIHASGF